MTDCRTAMEDKEGWLRGLKRADDFVVCETRSVDTRYLKGNVTLLDRDEFHALDLSALKALIYMAPTC